MSHLLSSLSEVMVRSMLTTLTTLTMLNMGDIQNTLLLVLEGSWNQKQHW